VGLIFVSSRPVMEDGDRQIAVAYACAGDSQGDHHGLAIRPDYGPILEPCERHRAKWLEAGLAYRSAGDGRVYAVPSFG
jgi:hypothetical protein